MAYGAHNVLLWGDRTMPILKFPNPRETGPEGIVALGGDLHPDSLFLAYSQGIFPWPAEGLPLLWFCPPERAVLDFADLHIGRRLARVRRQATLRFTVDAAFDDVIRACQQSPREGQDGTWITPAMYAAYCTFHRLGFAHSVEAWDGNTLVGGVYGVAVCGTFSGESMFYRQPYASRLALLHLIDHLQERGLTWIDIQQMTPHMAALGATLVSRDAFLENLRQTQRRRLILFTETEDG